MSGILSTLMVLICFGIEIDGNKRWPAYRAVRLNANPAATQEALVLWFVMPDERVDLVEESPGKLVFVAPPGRYFVRLVIKEPGKPQESARAEIIIEAPDSPDPPPQPPQPPGPQPPSPPNPATPEELALKWAEEVTSPQKASESQALAKSFDAVAQRIESGEWRLDGSLEEQRKHVKAILRESNRAALGEARTAWLPWFQHNQKFLDQFDRTAGSLMDYAKLWRQQAAGLRRVR
jgi:hypothetical protein